MEISESKNSGILVVAPKGRLNAASAQMLQDRLLNSLAGGEQALLLDLAQVDYISSAGLRSLLIVAKRLQACDGRFAICALTPNVREVFRMSGFDTIIDVHADLATALRSLG